MKRGRKPGALSRYTCRYCGTKEYALGGSHYFRCSACRDECLGSSPYDKNGKDYASTCVAAAIRRGELSHPSRHKCTDCGAQAQQYDHRDYNLPLCVDPVCRACNLRRGPAIPRIGFIEKTMERGAVPYRLLLRVRQLFHAMGIDDACLSGMPKLLSLEHWEFIVDALRMNRANRLSDKKT